MWTDLLLFVGIGAIIYDFAVGQVHLRIFTVRRSEHPIWFWVLTTLNFAVAVGCVIAVVHDLYRAVSR
jgi:hypothetical protein